MINRKNLLIACGVLLLLLLLFISGLGIRFAQSQLNARDYSVVYLTSGEIYIGHVSTFPRMKLEGAYILQNTKSPLNETKSDLQLFPLSEKPWAPTMLYLNPRQVLYWGPLDEKSAAAQGIREKVK